jgi:c-di-GMP-binding flagellar brake protein YcgR
MTDEHTLEAELALLDRVLVEADIDGRPVSFRPVVLRICPTELWLGLASPDGRLETMRPDQTVQLSVSRNGAAQMSQSRFIRPLDGSKMRVFAVVWPGVRETVQRRAHVRYQFDWPIHFRRLDPATREPIGKAACGTTLNVSAGGLLFESDTPVDADEELELTLPLSGGAEVKMLGVVLRVQGADEGGSGRDGGLDHTEAAVKFTRITALDQERIVRFVLLTAHRHSEDGSRPPQLRASEQERVEPPTEPAGSAD